MTKTVTDVICPFCGTLCDDLEVEVSDDGKGISEEGEKGFGIENMRFRTRMIDGRIEIERRPGGGTAVICMFPWSSSRLRLANNDLGSRTVS